MDKKRYRAAVEAILFACAEPISAQQIAQAVGVDVFEIQQTLVTLKAEYSRQGRGICLLQLEDRWQMAARTEYLSMIQSVMATRKNTPLSPAALEVLAIIAYNQPVSRAFVEQVRGVDSSSTIQKLMQRGLVEEAGRLDLPGRPLSFRTTDVFLRTFGLSGLEELPPLHEHKAEIQAETSPEQVSLFMEEGLPPEDTL